MSEGGPGRSGFENMFYARDVFNLPFIANACTRVRQSNVDKPYYTVFIIISYSARGRKRTPV